MDSIKLFISYSHVDELMVKRLLVFLKPLIDKGLISIWYDRKIKPGTPWNAEIENHIDEADIMLYCVSSDFCSSEACTHELIRGIKRRDELKTEVMPIIFRVCGWKDIKAISELQAVPTDGKPISSFKTEDEGFMDVYNCVKRKAEFLQRKKALTFSDAMRKELDNIGSLAALDFSGREKLTLPDIFVYPDLMDQSSIDNSRKGISGDELIKRIRETKKIVVSGESQSGKTSFAKMLSVELRKAGYFPVFFTEQRAYEGNVARRIDDFIKKQYSDYECVDRRHVVLILDDFYKAPDKDVVIDAVSTFERIILFTDDVYNLDITESSRLKEYVAFRIEPFSALKRGDLIAKWIRVQEKATNQEDLNYEHYDNLTRNVDQTLGKVLGRGVIPAYPFYILSILVTVETVGRPLDSEITSQGYCYQVLLTLSLHKAGVIGSMLDTYVNFLTELGYFHFEKRDGITTAEFHSFSKEYRLKYVLGIEDEELLERLQVAGVYGRNTLGYYSFTQRYLGYYFTARYISENFDECGEPYKKIITNLGNSSNAYIAVFIAHHRRNIFHLKELKTILNQQFSKMEACFLKKKDTDRLDKQAESVSKAKMPSCLESPIAVRRNELVARSCEEDRVNEEVPEQDQFLRELITAIRGTEVIGQIVKCRAGSISRKDLNGLMRSIVDAHGRVLSAFLSTFDSDGAKAEIVSWVSEKLRKRMGGVSEIELRHHATRLFWTINYFTILGIVFRCIQTVGSDKLLGELEKICIDYKSPMTDIVIVGAEMWFAKQLDVKRIYEIFDNTTGISRWILQQLVARYCATHKLDYKTRQQIGTRLEIGVTTGIKSIE